MNNKLVKKSFFKVKKALILPFFLFITFYTTAQNISINNNGVAPNASAILDIASITQGLLIPRMTDAQRQLLKTPASGLVIYNTTSKEFNFYNGIGWQRIPLNSVSVNSGTGVNSGGVAINVNGASPDPSSALDVSASNKGLLIPRTTQSSVIPVTGLIIYNTTTNKINYYDGTIWQVPCSEFIDNNKGVGATVQGVAINSNGTIADASAILDISSPSKGVLIPRMTSAQRDVIKNPAQSLLVYNISRNRIESWVGTAWQEWISYVPASVTASAFPSSLCVGTTLNLSGSATGATSWSWSGPNGYTSSLQNPTIPNISATGAGVYTLTASNACGASVAVNTTSVTVNPLPTGVTASALPASICTGSTLNLTGTATGASSWSWTGPNGFTSSLQNPTIPNISTAGTGVYTLTTSNICGTAASANTTSVNVNSSPTSSTASASPNPACTGASLNLTGSATGATSWNWTGPNGFSSALQNPTILNFSAAGTGVYTLTTSNVCGSASPTNTASVSVITTPVSATASASSSSTCVGSTLNLTGSATGATSWSWSGPNGFASTLQNPAVINISAAGGGVYTLTASNACGSATASTASVTVRNTPTSITASAAPNPICAGGTLNLTGASAGATSWSWSGPNGFTSSLQNPTISNITGAGQGNYTLTASNICGSTTSDPSFVTVNVGTPSPPTATAATGVAASSFIANWTASAGASSYFIDVSTVSNFASFVINNGNVGNVTSFTVAGLSCGTTYYYRVRARACGTSANSNTIIVATAACPCGTPQIFAAANLNAGTMVNSTGSGSQQTGNQKYCYNNVAANCATYGGLYEWVDVMLGAASINCDPCGAGGVQGMCPPGFHVPTDLEWSKYEFCIESTITPTGTYTLPNFQSLTNSRGTNSIAGPGAKLKAAPPTWDGTNASGFNALPAGYRKTAGGGFADGPGASFIRAYFWTATEAFSTTAYRRVLNINSSGFAKDESYRSGSNKKNGYSVRCLKN